MVIALIKPKELYKKLLIMVALVAFAFFFRMTILPVDGRVIFSTFYPAVALVTLFCGYRIGLLGMVLSGFLAYFFFLQPFQTLKILNVEASIGLATFFLASSIICLAFSKYSHEAQSKLFKPQGLIEKIFVMAILMGFAFLLRISALPIESRVIYSTFYPAIAVITLTCGFRIGLISMLVGGFLSYFYLLTPLNTFKFLDFDQGVGLLTYIVASGIICLSLREVIIRGQKIKQVNEALQDLMSSNSLGKNLEELVQVIASTIEMRDPYTSGHQRRVSQLGVAIGNKLGLPERNLIGIKLAGLIHDLGKMRIPIEILTKPGKLSDAEQSLIREHPTFAYEALKDLNAPWPLAKIVWQHHERIDGTGYPNQLTKDEILIEARILAVADVVEAMSAMRPYREGLGVNAALSEIRKNAGLKYDPEVVDACINIFESGEFHW